MIVILVVVSLLGVAIIAGMAVLAYFVWQPTPSPKQENGANGSPREIPKYINMSSPSEGPGRRPTDRSIPAQTASPKPTATPESSPARQVKFPMDRFQSADITADHSRWQELRDSDQQSTSGSSPNGVSKQSAEATAGLAES